MNPAVTGGPPQRRHHSTPGAPMAPAGLTWSYRRLPPIRSDLRVKEGYGNPSSGPSRADERRKRRRKTATSLEEAMEDCGKRRTNSDKPSTYRDQRCRTSMLQAAHDVGRINGARREAEGRDTNCTLNGICRIDNRKFGSFVSLFCV
ncbi:hypothetical protein NDU88_001904 [Pleurodeles waltl]|uniref:Uncharacterized protein n=1 Tax=Pleurodeles waltl TaxID=8319 RepID=A0AAV7R9C3_PLEWA|nr:hypothetical protein NDU88_001904 [Pleurodeles waltl]